MCLGGGGGGCTYDLADALTDVFNDDVVNWLWHNGDGEMALS